MLSRVADNLYWLGRYLERTENIARLLDVSASLLLDLPPRLSPGWQPLILITGSEELYAERGYSIDEQAVVHFVIADPDNPASMVSSIARAREIARGVRDILPREVWEKINELHLHILEHAAEAAGKRTRYGFLGYVSGATQALTGMFEGMLSEGEALQFLSLGRYLERADMTSRVLDVRAAAMTAGPAPAVLQPFETVLWMSVLRSLSAYHMYRLQTGQRVHGAGVVRFLLADEYFPRACACCLRRIEEVLHRLPNNRSVLRRVVRMRRAVGRTPVEALSQRQLHAFLDRLQRSLAHVSDELTRVYFLGGSLTAAPGARVAPRTGSPARRSNKHITARTL